MFGHLRMLNDERWFIGRMGITDPDNKDTLLVDWRAPVSRPFYTATPLHPEETEARSTIESSGWDVTRVSTENISSENADGFDAVGGAGGVSNALMTAVSQHRTGRMNDIVSTIQREQDSIIRSELRGTLLVQGGPGTGKTAVALHRAAFLLYEHRERLAKSGVLIVGPNPTFLRYIGNVLPSLGEDSAILTTIGKLLPGISATRTDPAAVAELKGRLDMAQAIRRALERHQLPGNQPVPVTLDSGDIVTLPADTIAELRKNMRRLRRPHNSARLAFEGRFRRAVAKVALETVDLQGLYSSANHQDVADLAAELAEDDGIRSVIDTLWPILSPGELLRSLLTDARLLAAVTPTLSRDERTVLLGSYSPEGWSESDIPLLDEALELLGADPRPALRAAARERAQDSQQLQYAQGVLDAFTDNEGPSVSARELVDRHAQSDNRTVAERAYADETWTYGHIIVDEAQELTPMALRSLIRRCPMQSMTLVGDIHQSSIASGRASWDSILVPQIRRYRREDLTVNYRTPAEVMDVAAGVLRVIDPSEAPSVSIRSTGRAPRFVRVAVGDLVAAVAAEVAEFLSSTSEGTLAVIAGAGFAGGSSLADTSAAEASMTDTSMTDAQHSDRVWFGTPRESKGLEFDRVLLVEPSATAAPTAGPGEFDLALDPPRLTTPEYRELYVALSRATQDLTILHSEELPDGLTV